MKINDIHAELSERYSQIYIGILNRLPFGVTTRDSFYHFANVEKLAGHLKSGTIFYEYFCTILGLTT